MIKQGIVSSLTVVALFAVSLAPAAETDIAIPARPFAVVELFTSEG